jgi:hypothetical protein
MAASLPTLAFLGALERFFELRARVGVVENLSPPLDHALFDDFGHDSEIIERVHEMPGFTPSEIAA